MSLSSSMKKRACAYHMGEPKGTSHGKDLSNNATNVIDKVATTNTRPTGPSANAASINAKGMKR